MDGRIKGQSEETPTRNLLTGDLFGHRQRKSETVINEGKRKKPFAKMK